MRWTDMRLRTVLTIAAVAACLRPADASVAATPLLPADAPGAQTPAQVFVRDSRASVQTDENINVHEAGLRSPRSDDDPATPVFDAAGNALFFTLEKWRAASGTVDILPNSDVPGDRVSLSLHRLIAFGHYSVFVRMDGADGPHFSPLDGSGITNNFDAREDGGASVTISAPQHMNAGSWIVTVYHSDAQDHGDSPGDFPRTAHQQLVLRLP